MAARSSAYLETLSSVTSTKTSLFARQQASYIEHKDGLFADLQVNPETSYPKGNGALQRIRRMLDEMSVSDPKKDKDIDDDDDTLKAPQPLEQANPRQILFAQMFAKNTCAVDPPANILERIKAYLAFGELDPAFVGAGGESSEVVRFWENQLREICEREERRMEVAGLVGKISSEWVAATNHIGDQDKGIQVEDEVETKTASFAAKKTQMDTFRSLVFSPHPHDSDTETPGRIREYLDTWFKGSPEGSNLLKTLRKRIREQCRLFDQSLSEDNVSYTKALVGSLANSDIFIAEKRSFLKDQILPNDVILSEILDVLRMWSADLGSWSWESAGLIPGAKAVKLQTRFHINGKYRVYLDMDPPTALFAHHVGTWFSIRTKAELKAAVFNPTIGAWKNAQGSPLDKKFAEKLSEQLSKAKPPQGDETATIEMLRRKEQRLEFFLNHLSDGLKPSQASRYSGGADVGDTKGKDLKENILHTCIAELQLSKALSAQGGSKSFTVVTSDLKWFGPSLSHETLTTVLTYFGFSNDIVGFFRRYLSVPCYFESTEEDMSTIQTRQRGIPLGHPLCDLAAELILFCLDFIVNQCSKGDIYLYRCFDDLWYWNNDKEKCERVWKEMQKFAKIFGLEFNEEKSGSMTFNFGDNRDILPASPAAPPLPEATTPLPVNPVTWGILQLSPNAEIIPNKELVETHVTELTRQLQSTSCRNSILSFVIAWNRYFSGFLPFHFSSPSYALGKSHFMMVLQQLSHIQNCVLKNINDGTPITLVSFLRKELTQRFPDIPGHLVPEVWFYWPHEMGGLGIKNPIIQLSADIEWKIEPTDRFDPERIVEPSILFSKQIQRDKHAYNLAKDAWDRNVCTKIPIYSYTRATETDSDREFLTETEYTSPEARTKFHRTWANLYSRLMEKPKKPINHSENRTDEVWLAIEDNTLTGDTYWRRIYDIYGREVVNRWGGFKLVEKEWVPAGLVESARDIRGGWEE